MPLYRDVLVVIKGIMAYDNSIRKQLLPVDARGLRGVFSRGKPQYGKFANAPHIGKDFNHQAAAQKRLRRGS